MLRIFLTAGKQQQQKQQKKMVLNQGILNLETKEEKF